MDRETVEEDFSGLRDFEEVKAVLLYGSRVEGRSHERSDWDICVVAPGSAPREVMRKVWQIPETQKDGYDVHTFEELPLKIKKRIIEENEVIWKRSGFRMQEYFHRYRKIWEDQAVSRGVA